MIDGLGRGIDYLRISVTDRCDLRCIYCMPEAGVTHLDHSEVLSYEEILRLAGIFASLGIKKIRLTGGEPLVRKGLSGLVAGLKSTSGIEKVVLTTNGMLLEQQLPQLAAAGLDGVNISLDTLDEDTFSSITRRSGASKVLGSIDAALTYPGMGVKLNCVPTQMNREQLAPLCRFAAQRGIPLRFIELMPIGEGGSISGLSEQETWDTLEAGLGKLTPMIGADPGDKCRYFTTPDGGRIGFISAVSHKFCGNCNRIRLTADGFLKTCLQYDQGAALKPLLGESDDTIRNVIATTVGAKPSGHHFGIGATSGDETRKMSQIGG